MIRIITDSAADYEQTELASADLYCIPITITFPDASFLDGKELSKSEFYQRLERGDMPKTSQPSPFDFQKIFSEAKEVGDELVVILLSSALSGTYQSAVIAKEELDYPKIYLVDSLRATAAQRLLVDYALRLRNLNISGKEIAEKLLDIRNKIKLYAYVDTLEYLKRGGRLSKTAAGIGTLAHVKPIVHINDEGEVIVAAKCIGRSKAQAWIMNRVCNASLNPEFPIYTLYSHNRDNCDALRLNLRELGFDTQDSCCCNLGPTIGAHVGAGACGVVFVEN